MKPWSITMIWRGAGFLKQVSLQGWWGVWLSAKSTMGNLVRHHEAREIWDRHLSGLLNSPHIQMRLGFSLENVLQAIEKELSEL